MFVHINSQNDVRNNNEMMMKRYIKQEVKHKTKLYLMRVSVRQMKKQHSETKRSMKRRKKKIVTQVLPRSRLLSLLRVQAVACIVLEGLRKSR